MDLHFLTAFIVLFGPLSTATVRTFESAFDQTIGTGKFPKSEILRIIKLSQKFSSPKVKRALREFKEYPNPADEPPVAPLYQFYKFLHPEWLKHPVKRNGIWRKIFDELVTKKGAKEADAREKLANHCNFLLFCGIMPIEGFRDKVTFSEFEDQVGEMIEAQFKIKFLYIKEETYLKLIFIYFMAGKTYKAISSSKLYEFSKFFETSRRKKNPKKREYMDAVIPKHQNMITLRGLVPRSKTLIFHNTNPPIPSTIARSDLKKSSGPQPLPLNEVILIEEEESQSKMSISSIVNL
jgi:hypothetical protein